MLIPLPLLFLLLSPLNSLASPLPPALTPLTSLLPMSHEPTTHDFSNRVLLIRHGEKPADKSATGLSSLGKKRAQCLRKKLGAGGKHNIGLIMAESYNRKTGTRSRPYYTVNPVAKDLGLKVDTSCERDDAQCVRRVVKAFAKTSDKDVLICWKHSELAVLAQALGAHPKAPYPDDRFDIMWVMKDRKIVSKKSEACKGLDERHQGRFDPDLEVEEDDEDDASDTKSWDDLSLHDLLEASGSDDAALSQLRLALDG